MTGRAHPILSVNTGSSSVKFALYEVGGQREALVARGSVERIGLAGGRLHIEGPDGDILVEHGREFPSHDVAVEAVFAAATDLDLPRAAAVGHRLVHGGLDHLAPEPVDERLLSVLRGLIPFAPLHLPEAIRAIEAVARMDPNLRQVACFDTSFHRRLPELAQRFPLPRNLWDEGVRRYGFHGLSYEYIVDRLADRCPDRVIIAHLGNGSSMAALRAGRPVETTMGLTPTGGFMMGTRSGDLDPGIVLHLMRQRGYASHEIDRVVNHEAGLLGVSGISPDMKTLLDARDRDPRAAQAVEMFCYQARKHVGALSAVLEGLDLLIFAGGIGERASPVRQGICRGLEYLGIELDPQRNESHADTISTPGSRCTVRVIPTNEDLMIARHVRQLVFGGSP